MTYSQSRTDPVPMGTLKGQMIEARQDLKVLGIGEDAMFRTLMDVRESYEQGFATEKQLDAVTDSYLLIRERFNAASIAEHTATFNWLRGGVDR